MKHILRITLFLTFAIIANAQPANQWTKVFSGYGSDYCFYDIRPVSSGGYICAGYTRPAGSNRRFFLVQTNSSGDSLWSRRYGNYYEECSKVVEGADGGFL
jgi:hypothetical protein